MRNGLVLTINPGATSTKCALFEKIQDGIATVAAKTVVHPVSDLRQFDGVRSQLEYRDQAVCRFVDQYMDANSSIIACAGRGGMLTPVPSGAIEVNDELVDFCLNRAVYEHASNLGAPLAFRRAKQFGVRAFIADPVSVDELTPIARISGCPDFPRFSFVHALNIRATARKVANELGKEFEELRCVVAHLGAGFSIAAINQGRIVDNDNRMESAPLTPERAGGVPPIPLVDACFSGKYTKDEMMSKLYGQGGLYAYLGTKDVVQVEEKIKKGDKRARLVYDAMIYQICKEIGAMASVLEFDIDAIVITGGLANSASVVSSITKRVERLGHVWVYPGSNENEALAQTVFCVLSGKEKYLTWPVATNERSEAKCQ